MKQIHVVCGIIRDKYGHILMGRRVATGAEPGIWEFPGGKKEEHESLHECLVREWREELGVDIQVGHLFHYAKKENVHLYFFLGKLATPKLEIEMNVHDRLGWFHINEVLQLSLFEDDKQIVRKLQDLTKI